MSGEKPLGVTGGAPGPASASTAYHLAITPAMIRAGGASQSIQWLSPDVPQADRLVAVRAALTALFDFTVPDASKTITLTVVNDADDDHGHGDPMTPRPLFAALLLSAFAACSSPVTQQQVELCPAAPCAPGATSLGALCGPALDGICSAAGTCLPPCAHAADCAALAPGAGPGEVAARNAVSGACSYMVAPKPQGAGL